VGERHQGVVGRRKESKMNVVRKMIGTIWAFPITLIGLLLMLPYGIKGVMISDWVLYVRAKRMLGPKGIKGANFGSVIFILDGHGLSDRRLTELMRHELCHRDQCYFFGPFTLLLYVLAVLHALATPGMRYYKDNFMECQAQKIARK